MSLLVVLTLAAAPMLTLPELAARRVELNGQVVRVRGYLGETCRSLECALSSKPWQPGSDWNGVRMSIGRDDDFDRRAAAFPGREIVLEAGFDNRSLTNFICLDRAATLQPASGSPITLVEKK